MAIDLFTVMNYAFGFFSLIGTAYLLKLRSKMGIPMGYIFGQLVLLAAGVYAVYLARKKYVGLLLYLVAPALIF